jgi:hypothetical protein
MAIYEMRTYTLQVDRPLVLSQEIKLLTTAPWGPQP